MVLCLFNTTIDYKLSVNSNIIFMDCPISTVKCVDFSLLNGMIILSMKRGGETSSVKPQQPVRNY
jgi:hypothetical protein